MLSRALLGLGLALVSMLAPVSAAEPPPPPAAGVKANVHAASSLAANLLALTPASGELETEAAMVQHAATSGLGEVMGWGTNYWDAVEPAVRDAVLKQFQAAYKLLATVFDDPRLDYSALLAAARKLAGHFSTMRAVTGASDTAGRTREVRTVAKLAAHHLGELAGTPLISDPAVRVAVALRTLRAAVRALEDDLAALPALAAAVRADLATLKAMSIKPPECAAAPDDACLTRITAPALPLLERIAAAAN